MSHAPVKILDWGDMSGIEDLGPVALKGPTESGARL